MCKTTNIAKSACVVLIAAACSQFFLSVGDASEPKIGEDPPPLGLEAILQAPSDAQATWKALKGKVVVLEFWATWCGPCNAAIPHLNELADKFKDMPIQFIAITAEDEKVVAPFLRRKPMHAWVGLDTDRSMFEDYGITAIPRTVVVDQKGVIAAITHPTSLTEDLLKDLLAGKKIAVAQPPISKQKHEALFQVIIRPSDGGLTKSISNKGSLTVSSATVLDILASSYGINPSRIVTRSALPEGRFDFIIQTPDTEKESVNTWLREAVESTFGLRARPAIREMDAFVLRSGRTTQSLAPTGSAGSASLSSGGGSLNCVNQSMNSLASSLEDILGRPVLDETGLTNRYDFQLLWDEKKSGEAESIELTQALHEQLGLELAPAKKAVELLEVTVASRSGDRAGR